MVCPFYILIFVYDVWKHVGLAMVYYNKFVRGMFGVEWLLVVTFPKQTIVVTNTARQHRHF